MKRVKIYDLNIQHRKQLKPMGISDLDRYSISKIDENTFTLTDADTLQTWQIEILRNINQEDEDELLKPDCLSR